MRSLVLIVHNIRSCHNVGALLRIADGLGVEKVYLTGYTPYPIKAKDNRLPHLANKVDYQIHKTALGAEKTVQWQNQAQIRPVIQKLRTQGFTIAALEQAPRSQELPSYIPADKLAIIVGQEVTGLESAVLKQADLTLEIPMYGQKESFNVSTAAAMALYHCRFRPTTN